jgi:hypothetical protein
MQSGSSKPHAFVYMEGLEEFKALSSPKPWVVTVKAREGSFQM